MDSPDINAINVIDGDTGLNEPIDIAVDSDMFEIASGQLKFKNCDSNPALGKYSVDIQGRV